MSLPECGMEEEYEHEESNRQILEVAVRVNLIDEDAIWNDTISNDTINNNNNSNNNNNNYFYDDDNELHLAQEQEELV